MNINLRLVEMIGLAILVGALIIFGWLVRGWYDGNKQLAQEQLAKQVTQAVQDQESKTAKIVEDKLTQLSTGERVIRHETVKVLQSPVYNINCVDDAGLQLIELAKRQYTDTRKSTDKVPDGNTDTKR